MRGSRAALFPFLEQVAAGKANLWSYVSISGAELCVAKGEGMGEAAKLERRELERLAKASKDAFEGGKAMVEGLLRELEEALLRCGYEVRRVKARLKSRGLFGVGNPFGRAAFDLGLSFDPILNVPFIPGSSMKGAIRSAYAFIAGGGEAETRLFGGPEGGASLVGVTDAYPVEAGENGYVLYPDVMTPHYRDARTELDAKPTPIVYLTVAPGVLFQFYVYFKRERGNRKLRLKQEGGEGDTAAAPGSSPNELGILDLAVLYALELGVGAKTSVGYSSLRVEEYANVGGPL